ncbi:MAG: class IV adenylate cyclase, partial [Anaerolineae bacterium]
MSQAHQEIEAKFYVQSLAGIEKRIKQLGGRLIQPRTLEINLRYDTPNRDLQRSGRVLRLRQDVVTSLTYKSGGQTQEGALARTEIEFTVSNFETAQQFLEALGYQVFFVYEKYRTIFVIGSIQIMLDELPYGDFVEIEGALENLKNLAPQLGLRWETAIQESYYHLFQTLYKTQGLTFRDLRFENFAHLTITAEQLG